ncbi:hypothetical protein PISMIDRAFT_17634 [Pisolithus microcarpus 441]|uniref:Chromo domain-containing protein n=1 Tax=Pisolithus microcarpus 441 TaxID=765257 RepID=A0A0C9YAW5_9AGAM|nr:hypothetical protein PISMIDRAFT_17634 [Pisolithus microcarpus 441]
MFLDRKWADENGIPLLPLDRAVPVYNVNGMKNRDGDITHMVPLVMNYDGHREHIWAQVTTLRSYPLVLGYTWLHCHNPVVSWADKTIKMTRCPCKCHDLAPLSKQEKEEANDMEYLHPKLCSTWSHSGTVEDLVPKEYHQYLKVFLKESSKHMPLRKPWDHAIDLKDTFIPLSVDEQKEVSDFINNQTRKGYICPSKSPQTSLVFFIPKKDGQKCMVQDYHYLNEHTGCRLFTKMDLCWGYNNIHIKEGDEWKAAFVTHKGSFEPLIMYFGLCNSPSTFQNMMNDIFGDMEDVVVIYIDDIMVFTKTDDEAEHDWIMKEVEFLGMVVGVNGIRMDKSKVKAIKDWPTPTKVKSVRAFLGLANFYHRFIKDFACIACPLNGLMRKDQPWTWQEEQQRSFNALKEAFTSAPILTFPDQDRKFCLETDASDFATGAVLSVEAPDGLWHPVAYYSHSMTPPKRNYQVFDKEMLAIIQALETWRHYLKATPYEFEIWTDHSNLQYFKMAQNLDCRQAQWAQYLLRFNYKLVYKPGTSMAKANALSRREDHEVKGDNQEVTLIDPTQVATVSVGMDKTLKAILKGATLAMTPPDGYELRNGLYIRDNWVYVPPLAVLPVIKAHHDTPIAGHLGWKALEYSVGQEVWLDTTHVRVDGCPSRKLMEKWIGPYKVLSVRPNAIELHLPKTLCIHPVVNVSRVKPYKGPLEGQKVTRPGPVVSVEDHNEEFEVKYIMDSCLKCNKLEFLVHWRGYGNEDCTWEPKSNLKGSPDVLCDFYNSHPSAPRKLHGIDSTCFAALFSPYENLTSCHSVFCHLEVDP